MEATKALGELLAILEVAAATLRTFEYRLKLTQELLGELVTQLEELSKTTDPLP